MTIERVSTIFTGHSLDLKDIVAISPVKIETKVASDWPMVTRKIFLEIFCRENVTIRYDYFEVRFLRGTATEKQKQDFQTALDTLWENRDELIRQWAKKTGKMIEASIKLKEPIEPPAADVD